MCYQATCSRCGKIGWQGCGQHIDEVMRNVPAGQRCTCARSDQPAPPRRDQRP